jgi:hypothetical protein
MVKPIFMETLVIFCEIVLNARLWYYLRPKEATYYHSRPKKWGIHLAS